MWEPIFNSMSKFIDIDNNIEKSYENIHKYCIVCYTFVDTWSMFAFELINDGSLELDTDLFYLLQDLLEEEDEEKIKTILIEENCALDKKDEVAFMFNSDIKVKKHEI